MAFPDRLHRKLADTGAELQKSDTPETGRRPNNLDGPIETIEATGGSSFSRRCRWRAS